MEARRCTTNATAKERDRLMPAVYDDPTEPQRDQDTTPLSVEQPADVGASVTDRTAEPAPHRTSVRRDKPSSVLTGLSSLGAMDWGCIVLGFLATFLLTLSGADGIGSGTSGLLRLLGFAALLALVVTAALLVRERVAVGAERSDWDTFERSLERGVRMRVPEDMNYAASFPPALAELGRTGDPRFAGVGAARHAILGEQRDVHFCLFQHHHQDADGHDAVDTVGLVSLPADREYDDLPDLRVDVLDPGAPSFENRFAVTGDDRTADLLLDAGSRAALMRREPFGWQVIGNQLITIKDGPSTPGETVDLIRDRIEVLAQIADGVPRDLAGLPAHG